MVKGGTVSDVAFNILLLMETALHSVVSLSRIPR